jgi:abequosyltransferase
MGTFSHEYCAPSLRAGIRTAASPADGAVLTIIVPTCNRAVCLKNLLNALRQELSGLAGQVVVVIGDNASSDKTPEITAEFAAHWSDTHVLRHATNLGAEENFCRCIEQVRTPYFWIIGDDDLPRAGFVTALLTLLAEEHPDLVYLSSHWTQALPARDEHEFLVWPLKAISMDQLAFARSVHVWMSFISGCIVKRELAPDDALRRFVGTNLVQLGWVMEALRNGEKFVYVRDQSVYATAGNTGSYPVLKVFGQNFQRITRQMFNADHASRVVAENIIDRTSIAFLPDLVWSFRNERLGRFDQDESFAEALRPERGSSWVYHLIILPIGLLPVWSAYVVLIAAHCMARALNFLDRFRAHLSGQVRRTSVDRLKS